MNNLHFSLQGATPQLAICVPCESRNQHIGNTNLSQQISPAISKQELFPAVDIQGVPRRSLINTAPLSPNHYGSILAQTLLPFRINKRSQLSGSYKTSVHSNTNEMLMRSEREITTDVKELQQKKQKIQVYKEKLMNVNLKIKLQNEGFRVDGMFSRRNVFNYTDLCMKSWTLNLFRKNE